VRRSWPLVATPDGQTLYTSSFDGSVIAWDLTGRQRFGRRLAAVGAQLQSLRFLAFAPDGSTLATSGSDGTVLLWDVGSRKQIGTPLPGPPQQIGLVRFNPAGGTLAAAFEGGSTVLWDVELAVWQAHACAVAGRNLTRQEREEFLSGRRSPAPCRQWPA